MKKKLFCMTAIIMAVFHVNQSQAQSDTTALHYANTIRVDDLKKHLFELASDSYEGRETGTPGQKKAAKYIADFYKANGIAPVVNGSYLQTYPLKRVRYGNSTISSGATTYRFKNDFFFFGSEGEVSVDANELVFAGYGIDDSLYSDYTNLDVKGKILMVLDGEPMDKKGNSIITKTPSTSAWTEDFRLKLELAQQKGARAIMIVNEEYAQFLPRISYWLDQPRLTLDYPVKTQDEVPYFIISPTMANSLLAAAKKPTVEKLKAKINKKLKTKTFGFTCDFHVKVVQDAEVIEADNILAFIEGTDPVLKNEIVIVSAHYDHIGIVNGEINNGADDDGSGTVSAMEIAQAFAMAKREGHGSRRSILVLNVSGEEKGLLGSEWYSEYPVFPLANTVCDLNIDMIGRVDEQHASDDKYVYIIGSDKLSTSLHSISEKTNATYTKLKLDYTYNDPNDPNRFYYRSDHYNFAKHNIPVIFYFSGVHEDYHQPGDDAEKIHFEKMSTIAQLVFLTAWEVANRDERLKVDVVSDFK